LLGEQDPNGLVERAAHSLWRTLPGQYTETTVAILLVAALVSGLPGFVQAAGAERAMASLKQIAIPTFHARRTGQVPEVADLRANPAMAGFVALTLLIQVAAVYVPVLDEFFEGVPISEACFGLCLVLGRAAVLGAAESVHPTGVKVTNLGAGRKALD
jgi:hypothetical protein